jgi:hypothetical protein
MNFVELPALLPGTYGRSSYRFLKESSLVEKLTVQ